MSYEDDGLEQVYVGCYYGASPHATKDSLSTVLVRGVANYHEALGKLHDAMRKSRYIILEMTLCRTPVIMHTKDMKDTDFVK